MKRWLWGWVIIMSGLCKAQSQLEPTPTEALVMVKVTGMDGSPRKSDKVTFQDSISGKEYSGITNAEGKFSILLPKGRTYLVKIKSFESDTPQAKLKIPDVEGLVKFEYTIKYELPRVYRLHHVHFDFGKATLRPSSYKALDNLAELLRLKPTMVIEVAGHTDNVGSYEANVRLSQQRAEAVKSYLVKRGIAPERIIAKGYGPDHPIAPNDSEENRQKNRRVEIKIIRE